MKNCSNHSFEINGRHYCLEYFCMAQRFAFVTFEILVVFISLLIVSTSSLVIYRITKAYKINKKKQKQSSFCFYQSQRFRYWSGFFQCTFIRKSVLCPSLFTIVYDLCRTAFHGISVFIFLRNHGSYCSRKMFVIRLTQKQSL